MMAMLGELGDLEATDGNPAVAEAAPPLYDGQRLDQPTFHDIYSRMPEDFRAELIDGVVYLNNRPVPAAHGCPHNAIGAILFVYHAGTPGTSALGRTTIAISPWSEVEPDCSLKIKPEFGGRTRLGPDGFIVGCPEIIVEVAVSSLSIDLGEKKRAYEKAGAPEYLAYNAPRRKFYWFTLRENRFEPLEADPDGVFRSRAFPGLWLDAASFSSNDHRAVLASLQSGLESREHAEFVERLRQQRAVRP